MKESVALYTVSWSKMIGAGKRPAEKPLLPPPPEKGTEPAPPLPGEKKPATPPVPPAASLHDLSYFVFVDGGFRFVGEMKAIQKPEIPGKNEAPRDK